MYSFEEFLVERVEPFQAKKKYAEKIIAILYKAKNILFDVLFWHEKLLKTESVQRDTNLVRFDALWKHKSFLAWIEEHYFKHKQVPSFIDGYHGRAYFSSDNKLVCKLTARDDDAKVCALVLEAVKKGIKLPVVQLDIVKVRIADAYAIMQDKVVTSKNWQHEVSFAVNQAKIYLHRWLYNLDKDETKLRSSDEIKDLVTNPDPWFNSVMQSLVPEPEEHPMYVEILEGCKPYLRLLFQIIILVGRNTGILLKDLHTGNIGWNPRTQQLVIFDLGFNIDFENRVMPKIRVI